MRGRAITTRRSDAWARQWAVRQGNCRRHYAGDEQPLAEPVNVLAPLRPLRIEDHEPMVVYVAPNPQGEVARGCQTRTVRFLSAALRVSVTAGPKHGANLTDVTWQLGTGARGWQAIH